MVTISTLILILGMAAVTYATRGPVLSAIGRLSLPAFIRHSLEVVPGAALASLTVSFVLYPGGELVGFGANPSVYAALVTLGAALFLRNVGAVVVVGMAALHLFRWVL